MRTRNLLRNIATATATIFKKNTQAYSPTMSSPLNIPAGQRGPDIPGMTGGVQIGVPFVEATLSEIDRLGASKVFVLSNNSSRGSVSPLIDALTNAGKLAAPLCSDVGMGGGETGLMKAADAAADAGADCLVTVGGGAVQDAGKLIRLWLAGRSVSSDDGSSAATPDGIRAVLNLDPLPSLPPQVCCPNSFAMAELTSVAGMTLSTGVKSGASNPAIMPTSAIFDPSLTDGLPDWVRFGTALRCVEHAVGTTTHPKANEEQITVALKGLAETKAGLEAMTKDPTSKEAMEQVYVGGWCAVRALNTNGCYPALGHLVQNMYSAKYGVHQGSCSGVLCGRIMSHHVEGSAAAQKRIAAVLTAGSSDDTEKSAAQLVTELVKTLPGVARDHADAGVDVATLREFAESRPLERFNTLSPTPFTSADDVYSMLTRPVDQL